jgi:hypothetical protein
MDAQLTFEKNRQLFLYLPVPLVLAATLTFYVLGGGKAISGNRSRESSLGAGNQAIGSTSALNASLPTADKGATKIYSSKLEAYTKSHEDSTQRHRKDNRFAFLNPDTSPAYSTPEPEENEPGGMERMGGEVPGGDMSGKGPGSSTKYQKSKSSGGLNTDVNQARADFSSDPNQHKLTAVEKQLNQYESQTYRSNGTQSNYTPSNGSNATGGQQDRYESGKKMEEALYREAKQQLDALQKQQEAYYAQLQRDATTPKTGESLTGSAENSSSETHGRDASGKKNENRVLVAVGRPDKSVVSRLKVPKTLPVVEDTAKAGRYPVKAQPLSRFSNGSPVSLLGADGKPADPNFPDPNAIAAVIHGNQLLVNGGMVKIRILHEIQVGRFIIPAQSLLSGMGNIQGERLNIVINHIRHYDRLFPVELNVYDLDGNPGLYIPGSMARDAGKQGINAGVGGMMFMPPQTVTGQLTGAAIETTKGFINKKAALVKINLKANYRIYLKPGNP